jgi:hypothetical protein
MPYFMLVMGKQGMCRAASSYRNNAGWHDLIDLARPLSGSGYRSQGRDELNRVVEVKMLEEPRARQITLVLERDKILSWVAVEAVAYDGKPQSWWTFFDVTSAGASSGTDYSLPTNSYISYIFEFHSARWNVGTWPGAIPTGSEGRSRSLARRRSRHRPGRLGFAGSGFPEAAAVLDWARPSPGAWCRACRGTRWWTERQASRGWRCMRCLPPDHLPPEAIRRESEPDDAPVPAAPHAPRNDTDPLFRQAGIGLDDDG